jgi:hypothetical protein
MKFILSIILVFSALQIFSQNKLISNGNYFEGEPYLAIDPQNQQHLVAAWMGFQLNNKIVIKSSVSTNGGVTWSAPIWQPHISAGYSSADVSLGFDSNGNLFMSYIDYDNVLFSGGKILVNKSTDGGISWGNPTEVTSIYDCPGKLCIDRPWIAVDRSGTPSDGTIYVTSMNANQPTLINPPYNPYLAVSIDGGQTFSNPRTIDSTGFLAGSTITQPMPSPVVKSDGKFVAVYPSYLQSQSVFPRLILAESTNQGAGMNYKIAYQGVDFGASNQLLKSGPLLRSNPSNPNQLAFFFLSDLYDGSDIMMIETTDGGTNWSAFKRINQDTQGNGKLQDLVWADFDNDGDLVVCWRDRRNANGTSYQVPTEIYATVRYKDSSNFEPDFAISSMQVAHDTILEDNGNDFMHVAFENDTVYAVWGDVRSGTLKIYLNKWNPQTNTSSIHEINTSLGIQLYPNPTNDLLFLNFDKPIDKFKILNSEGKILIEKNEFPKDGLNIKSLPSGSYFIHCFTENSIEKKQFTIFK